jgi:hypothetical protein
MKIKPKHVELFKFYMRRGIRHGEDSSFGSMWHINANIGEQSAVCCFFEHESTGRITSSASPLMVRLAMSGKALIKLTIDQWAESVEQGLLTKFEVFGYCEDWPKSEKNNVHGRMAITMSSPLPY